MDPRWHPVGVVDDLAWLKWRQREDVDIKMHLELETPPQHLGESNPWEGDPAFFLKTGGKLGGLGHVSLPSRIISQKNWEERKSKNMTIGGVDVLIQKTQLNGTQKYG